VSRVPKVALLWTISNHFGRALVHGIARYARLHTPWSLYMCSGDFERGRPRLEFTGALAESCSAEEIEYIKGMGIPVVLGEPNTEELAVGNLLRGVSTIATDSPAIANMAADHLVGQGLRSFAFCGIQNCPWSLKREQAFCGRIGEIGFPCERHRINVGDWPRQGDWTREWPAEQSRLSLWLKSLPRQTGLIACNDMCGRHVLEACREARVRVPDHIAVVGVGNDDLACELSHPPLSSVALDVEKAGYEAAHLLDALMSGAIKNGVHVVPVSPLWVALRGSSNVIVPGDFMVADALRFVEDHAKRGIGVPDVVSEMGVSRRTMERRFFRATGRSILTEIKRARLDCARRLLQETDLPMYRVAMEAGFSSTRMLNRILRRVEGCSPGAYRLHLNRGRGQGGMD
jgi:LacI family transcriptional regulator